MTRSKPMRWLSAGALVLLMLAMLPFAAYAVRFGLSGLRGPLPEHYLFQPHAFSNAPMALHMILGAGLTLLAPLQILTARRANGLHRRAGPVVVALALSVASAGLAFIALRGTIGGANMNLGFTVYGLAMIAAATCTARFAIAGNRARHRRWALRLVVLAIASWLFRLHYGLWYLATGGVGSTEDLTGAFDRIQVWAFFVPYLLLLELKFRRERPAPS